MTTRQESKVDPLPPAVADYLKQKEGSKSIPAAEVRRQLATSVVSAPAGVAEVGVGAVSAVGSGVVSVGSGVASVITAPFSTSTYSDGVAVSFDHTAITIEQTRQNISALKTFLTTAEVRMRVRGRIMTTGS
jgi:hypothetical protein